MMSEKTKREAPISPYLVLCVGIFAIGISAILVRMAQGQAIRGIVLEGMGAGERMSSLVIATWRLSFSALILLPLCLAKKQDELRRLKRADLSFALLSGMMLAIHFASWILSLEYTSVASSTVLITTSPLWVAIASPFLLKERVPTWVKIGLGLALLGSGIVAWDSLGGTNRNPLWGNQLALIGAVSGATYLMIGRKLRGHLSLLTYTTLVYGFAAICLLTVSLMMGERLGGYSTSSYLICLSMALVPQLLGHSSFNYALAYLTAAYVTLTIVSEPISATILAFLLLGETPSLWVIAGGLLIVGGIFIATTRS